MTALQAAAKEKAAEIRSVNRGRGALSLSGLRRELGVSEDTAREWAKERGIGNRVGKRIVYDVASVAKHIVQERGMY